MSVERKYVDSAIQTWNQVYAPIFEALLLPLRWETHSFPEMGTHPQSILNRQFVDQGNVLVAIFGSRLGTPTEAALSGTVEEIERFRKAGRPVALYFSTAAPPRDADRDQLEAVEAYRRERQRDTLYFTFANPAELQELVSRHLPRMVCEIFPQLRGCLNANETQ